MTKNPYENVMERARKNTTDKGHELGDWEAREDGQGFVAICDRCGGKLTVSGESKMFLVGLLITCGGSRQQFSSCAQTH